MRRGLAEILVVERLSGAGVDHQSLDPHREVPGEGDALDPYAGPPADPHPDRATGDRGAHPTLQDRVQVVGPGVATAGPPQVEAGAEQGGDGLGGPLRRSAVHPAGKVVEQTQPGPGVHRGGVLDGDPESRLGDIGVRIRRGGEDEVAGVCALHGRV
jgi:hypothetical protein